MNKKKTGKRIWIRKNNKKKIRRAETSKRRGKNQE